jgi:hypothetical protein
MQVALQLTRKLNSTVQENAKLVRLVESATVSATQSQKSLEETGRGTQGSLRLLLVRSSVQSVTAWRLTFTGRDMCSDDVAILHSRQGIVYFRANTGELLGLSQCHCCCHNLLVRCNELHGRTTRSLHYAASQANRESAGDENHPRPGPCMSRQ